MLKIVSKKATKDLLLNMLSSSFPIILLQVLIYPKLAVILGNENYGLMITLYSAWIMIGQSLGNVLNNVRLLHDKKYQNNGVSGDFLFILRGWGTLGVVCIGLVTIYYYHGFVLSRVILSIIISVCIIVQTYIQVEFRINLDFKKILINSIMICSGYLFGYVFVNTTGIWELLFLFGYGFGFIYCIINTSLLNEGWGKTCLYRNTVKDCKNLLISNVVNYMMNYADKLILYPLMGGYAVSIYYTATMLGKMVSLLTGPFNSFMLSYISKWDNGKKYMFNITVMISVVVAILGYIIVLGCSKPILQFLFPQWMDIVLRYLPITTANVAFIVITSALNPMILRFCDSRWQIYISAISFFIYFIFAIILWIFLGLFGFCVGTALGNFVKIILMLSVYYRQNK